MERFVRASSVLGLLVGSGAGMAATIVVDPSGAGQFTDLQAAIDAAAPGDVLRIIGGAYPPITIDKPLTLVGAPVATLQFGPQASATDPQGQAAAVTLKGSGVGRVALHGLRSAGFADSQQFERAGAGLAGRGFEAVEVLHCEFVGAKWANAVAPRPGAAGIAVKVPFVAVSHSMVGASDAAGSDDDELNCLPNAESGAPGLLAEATPSGPASVLLLDSTVRGGRGSALCIWQSLCWLGYLCPLPDLPGRGGPGVAAGSLFSAGSVVQGGPGGFCVCGDFYVVYPAGTQPAGNALQVDSAFEFLPGPALSAPIALGGTASLSWSGTGPGQLLFLATGAARPIAVPGGGPFALDLARLAAVLPLPAGPAQVTAPIPTAPALLGLGLAVQAYDPAVGLTRPSVDALFGGEWTPAVVAATDVPKPVADAVGSAVGMTTSSIAVSGLAGTIANVDVVLDLDHPALSNLRVTLAHPDGTMLVLLDHPYTWAEDLDTTFDALTATVSSLDTLRGKPANGTWILTIVDSYSTFFPPGPAVLESWKLRFELVP